MRSAVRCLVRRVDWIAVAFATLLATTFVWGGTPVLRHDWPPPLRSIGEAAGAAMGWDALGLGSAVGYPTSFMVVFARTGLAAITGTAFANVAYMFACWLLVATGARILALRLGAPPAARAAAVLFAIFNPWSYTQFVAGHLYIILAYGATFWLAAEARYRPETRDAVSRDAFAPRSLVLVALVLAFAPQIQFLVVDGAIAIFIALRARLVRPLIALALFGALVAVTIVLTRQALLGTPFTLAWERSLSIEPADALLLRGYFTGYTHGIDPVAAVATIATIALAAGSLATKRRSAPAWLLVAAASAVFATGTKGFAAGPFAWLVGHVPEIGLFRELYDLLGFTAIAYVALASVGTSRRAGGILGAAWLLAGVAGPVAWLQSPPSQFWIAAESLPTVDVRIPTHERYALVPAAGPMRFGDRGSGIDPDARLGPDDTGPLNEAVMGYPVNAAFGRFLKAGDARGLAALGVATIVERGSLHTDPAIEGGLALPTPAWLVERREDARIDIRGVEAKLSIGEMPAIGTMLLPLGGGNVQLGDASALCRFGAGADACDAPRPLTVPVSGVYVAAASDWVDARLAFLEAPELAQSYGGALTTNAEATLPIRGGDDALVWVRGRLRDAVSNAVVDAGRGTPAYHWIHLPVTTHALRCEGMCVVAAQTTLPPGLPLEPPRATRTPLAFTQWSSWFAYGTLPAGPQQTVRYDVRYDPRWHFLVSGIDAPHLRIDAVTNGWVVPARSGPERFVIVEIGALVTSVLEAVTVVGFTLLLAPAFVRRSRRGAATLSEGKTGVLNDHSSHG